MKHKGNYLYICWDKFKNFSSKMIMKKMKRQTMHWEKILMAVTINGLGVRMYIYIYERENTYRYLIEVQTIEKICKRQRR